MIRALHRGWRRRRRQLHARPPASQRLTHLLLEQHIGRQQWQSRALRSTRHLIDGVGLHAGIGVEEMAVIPEVNATHAIPDAEVVKIVCAVARGPPGERGATPDPERLEDVREGKGVNTVESSL